jgi:hypothetical protein
VVELQSVYSKLTEQLVARSVADKMFEQKTLTKSEHEAIIDSNRTETGAAQTLVNILLNSPTAVYESFLAALQHTNQQHIQRLIQCAGMYLLNIFGATFSWDVRIGIGGRLVLELF